MNVLLRLLQQTYNIDVFGYSDATCKIMTFILLWNKTVTAWFIVFASIDRFLCSSRSATVRSWSNPRLATYTVLCICIAVGLAYIYVPIQYQLRQTAQRCPSSQSTPAAFSGAWNFVIFSIGPSIIMLTFGLMTIKLVRARRNRIAQQSTNPQVQTGQLPTDRMQRAKRIDRQLTNMIILQGFYFSALSTPVSVNWLYTSIKPTATNDAVQSAQANLFLNVAGYLSITGACTSFYIFTLSSKLFRTELRHIFKHQEQTSRVSAFDSSAATQKN